MFMPMALRTMRRSRRRRGRRAGRAAAAGAGAVEEDADPLADIAEILKIDVGDEATDEELKAAIHKAVDAL